MKKIVSITPLPVEEDSRTYKIAASFARFGYKSIVLEGETSRIDKKTLPFELHSLRIPRCDTPSASQQKKTGTFKWLSRKLTLALSKTPLDGPLELLTNIKYIFCMYTVPTLLKSPRASIYYLHWFYQFPAVYILCLLYNACYIYDAHDFYSGLDETPQHKSVKVFQRWLEALCIKNAAESITVSDGVANLQVKSFGRRGMVIRNCQDQRLDQKPRQDVRGVLGLGADSFLLIVVGCLKKGLETQGIIEAMSRLPDMVHLVFLGKGYEQQPVCVKSPGLKQRIHMLCPVSPTEVVPFIRSADASLILYYPQSENYLYCLPNGFFQSISAGLPILYPELPEIAKIANRYSFGQMIDPFSSDILYNAVMSLLNSPELLKSYKKNSAEAASVLNWELEEQLLRDLLQHYLPPERVV